jgi:hypothetical protein
MYVRELYFLISISSVGRTLVGRSSTVTPVFSKIFHLVELSGKSCPVGPELQPLFDASSPPGCCPQSHEFFLIKGMKHWDSGWNAQGSRTFIATVNIAAAVIGSRSSGTKGQGKLSLALNLLLNWVSCPVEALCDQIGGSGAIFSWLYG